MNFLMKYKNKRGLDSNKKKKGFMKLALNCVHIARHLRGKPGVSRNKVGVPEGAAWPIAEVVYKNIGFGCLRC
jgi:hypothetical protein